MIKTIVCNLLVVFAFLQIQMPVAYGYAVVKPLNVEKIDHSLEEQIEIEESNGDVLSPLMSQPATREEMMPELFDNNFVSKSGALGVTDEAVVPELQNDAINRIKGTGIWGFQFIYFNKTNNTYTVLSENRVHEQIKPASTLKLFTGWLSYDRKCYPVNLNNGPMAKDWNGKNKGYRANLNEMLRRSDNMMAEESLREIAKSYGHVEIPDNGIDELKLAGVQAMKDNYKSLDDSDLFDPKNGSGLNTTEGANVDPDDKLNKLAPRTMVNVLQVVRVKASEYDKFKSLLARPGQVGTLSNRFAVTKQIANIYAKTGTLARTKSLSGFIDTKKGTLIFAIIGDKLNIRPSDASEHIDNIVYVHTRYLVNKGL